MRRELPRDPQISFVLFCFFLPYRTDSETFAASPRDTLPIPYIHEEWRRRRHHRRYLPSVLTFQAYLALGELCRVERRVVEEHEPVASQSMLLPVVIQQDQKLQHTTLSDRRAGEGRSQESGAHESNHERQRDGSTPHAQTIATQSPQHGKTNIGLAPCWERYRRSIRVTKP